MITISIIICYRYELPRSGINFLMLKSRANMEIRSLKFLEKGPKTAVGYVIKIFTFLLVQGLNNRATKCSLDEMISNVVT